MTTADRTASMLLQQFKVAGIVASEVGLSGRFHSSCYREDIDAITQFCDSNPGYSFPKASKLVFPTQTFGLDQDSANTNMNRLALQSILLEQSRWYETFAHVLDTCLKSPNSTVISIEPDRCVPPSLMRKLGPRLIHMTDLDYETPQLSSSVLDPEAPFKRNACGERDIAVIGMSIKVAGADDLEEFCEILRDGRSQHEEVPESRFGFETQWRELDTQRKWYGNFMRDVDAFDHKFFKKSPRESASQDPQQRLMLEAAYQAVQQSGYFSLPYVDKHIGCYIGACAADYEHNVACYPANAFTATGNLKSFIPGKISHYFGWTGPGMTLDTACSASAVAIHLACRAILEGECTGALAGGVATMENPLWFQNLAGATFLSPTGQCKPFDDGADGYCRGEGIACVFLKKMSAAIADGNQIFGCIPSTCVYQNENCTPLFVPNSPSLSQLFTDVVRRGGLSPQDISLVEAHGTGTPVGDPAEYKAIRQALAGPQRSQKLPIGSVKGFIGHTEGASGVISLIKVLLMMQEGFIPPQASFTKMSHHIETSPSDMMFVPEKLEEWQGELKAALINNYGASGSNASMTVLNSNSGGPKLSLIQSLSIRHPFWITGLDCRSVSEYCKKLLGFIRNRSIAANAKTLANLSFNINRQSNRALTHGLILSSNSISDLEGKLASFTSKNQEKDATTLKNNRPVILCFGGQISTFIGLDREIYNSISILRRYLDQCDSTFRSIGLDGIYPHIFSRTPIEDTVKLQNALFALQYSCAKCWIDCGIQVAAVVGHSFGEITALCVSGSLSLKDAVVLVSGRASIVRDSWSEDRGSMIAADGDLELVQSLITRSNDAYDGLYPASIACYNGPRSFTLAGSIEAMDIVAAQCASDATFQAIKTKKLNVSNAFHSTLVEPLVEKLEELGASLKFQTPSIPFERATETRSSGDLSAKFVAEHMRNPVFFDHAIQRLSKDHPSCVWLEAGSSSTITIMANRALGSSSGHFQAMNITADNATQNLTDTTVKLWEEGLRVAFWPHHPGQTSEYAPLMLPPYQFEKSRHWLELKTPVQAKSRNLPAIPQNEIPTTLWTFVGYQDDAKRTARFRVNTMTDAYKSFVSGHLIVKTAPICPATLEVDMAVEALISIMPEGALTKMQPQIQNMENHAPICVDPSRFVWIEYCAQDKECLSWAWRIVSNDSEEKKAPLVHVTAEIRFRTFDDPEYQHEFARYERLVSHQKCIDVLDNGKLAEHIIQGPNIYKTFAEIVDYGTAYQGVKTVVGRGNECAGLINKKYEGGTWLDTLLSDCFSQVPGVWINCMTDRPASDLFIASGCELVMRSPKVQPDYRRPDSWHVYATHHKESDKVYLTDVFIFNANTGLLVEVMLGINFSKVPKASMSRILERLSSPDAVSSKPSTAVRIDTPKTGPGSEVETSLPETKEAMAAPKKKKTQRSKEPDISDQVRNIIATVSGLEAEEIQSDSELADFGIDSLMGMELAREVESFFQCTLDQEELMEATNFRKFVKCIAGALKLDEGTSDDVNSANNSDSESINSWSEGSESSVSSAEAAPKNAFEKNYQIASVGNSLEIEQSDILEEFSKIKMLTDQYITDHKVDNFVNIVLAKSNQLCVALVVEAFEELGCSLRTASAGQTLERVQYQPQHQRLIEYVYDFLENVARLIDKSNEGSKFTRTAMNVPAKSSEALLEELLKNFPEWIHAHKLTHYAGKHLAKVLTGKTDGIAVIFGSAEARSLVAGLYCEHSFNKVSYNQMKDFIGGLVSRLDMSQGPLRILEMGAGTGGTTLVLAPYLATLGVPIEYTYTDISASMVAQAKRKFKAYPFMKFAVHDIEKLPEGELLDQHIVIASNAVHATHNLTKSCENIRKALRPDGLLMILEMVEIVPFVDIIFGLLEGWWLFDDGRRHAIASPSRWQDDLHKAGFGHVDWTDGELLENEIQKVIVALASGSQGERLPRSSKLTAEQASQDTLLREAEVMRYVEKHSQGFSAPTPAAVERTSSIADNKKCVLVTGASGSLGSHLVATLAQLEDVRWVVCVNRRGSTEAKTRQQDALTSRGIKLDETALAKLRILETDSSKPQLGLPEAEYEWLIQNLTHILHNAWPMSGTRTIKAFEPQFQTLRNLIELARQVACQPSRPSKVGFEFVSSIGVVGHYPFWSGKTYVPEERMEIRSVLPIGYCEAKLACERILDATLHKHPEHFRVLTTRPGQIAGSSISGYWNPVEHLAFLFKSSQSLKAIPDFDGTLCWVPVDDVASTAVDLLLSDSPAHPIYHIDNPIGQPWKDMVRVLANEMGIAAKGIVPFKDWVRRVRESPLNMDADNPAARLIGFLEKDFRRMSCGGLILDTTKSREHSKTLAARGPVSPETARKYVQAWKEMGFLRK